jgi:hypothetical protein
MLATIFIYKPSGVDILCGTKFTELTPMSNSRFVVVHRFLRDHRVYPLVLSTLLCAILIATRVALSSSRNYGFLVWNLFLAWLPYLFSL